jgi:hypothetical protein
MQARIVPAASGVRWLVEGWHLFRAAPLGWPAVVFLYLLLTQMLALMPIIGFGALLLVPTFTVGLLAAARALSRGGALEVRLLFDGFRKELLRPQLALGVIYLLCTILIVAGVRLTDADGTLRSVLAGGRKAEEVQFGDVFPPLAVFALIYTPVSMMFWFAPQLAAWHTTGVVKALFFSFAACLMNWRAFVCYVAAIALAAVVAMLLLGMVGLAGGGSATAAAYLAVTILLVLLPVVYASIYASYREVFGVEANGQ